MIEAKAEFDARNDRQMALDLHRGEAKTARDGVDREGQFGRGYDRSDERAPRNR